MSDSNSNKQICFICRKKLKTITESHVKTHGLSLQDYKFLYGERSNNDGRCVYENKITHYKCNLIVKSNTEDKFCILHNIHNNNEKFFREIFKIILELNDEIHLEGVNFPLDIDLSKMKFPQKVFFTESIFNENVNFEHSIFLEDAEFSKVKFKKDVSFKLAIFQGNVGFWETEFFSKVNFQTTTFRQRVTFVQAKFATYPQYIRFVNTHFEKPEKVHFAENNLSYVLFKHTNLTLINFGNIIWPKTSVFFSSRKYLADEFSSSEILDRSNNTQYYNSVKLLYQQLKRNFEDKRSFVEAGDFHYGEMECYRKSNKFRRYFPLNLINLYRLSSAYGQRYIRAGIVLLILLFIFALSHLFSGLTPVPEKQHTYQPIDYNIENLVDNIKSIIPDFFKSTVYCLQVLTRTSPSDRLYQPASFGGEVLNVIFPLLIFLQAVFFALAVRRHFKR